MNKTNLSIVLMAVLVFAFGSIYAVADTTSDSTIVRVSLLNQDPSPAVAGDSVDLRFKVENIGGVAANNFMLEVLPDYPYSTVFSPDFSSSINLDPYQTGNNYVNLKYTVKIDKDAMQGTREIRIRYKYDGQNWITETLSINIQNRQFAQIIFIDKAKLEPGKETDIKFTITNVGNAPLQNMVFSWEESTGVILPVYSGDSKYVKFLAEGDSVDLNYKVIADVNAAPGLYPIDMVLRTESTTNASPSVINTKAGIFVGGETDFDVAFSESSAGTTSLSVSNTGNNPAQSVSVQIPQQDNFRVTGTNSAIIGNLDKGDYTLVSFPITSTAAAANLSGRSGQQTTGQQATGQQAAGQQRNFGNSSAARSGNAPNTLRVQIVYTDTTGERRTVEKMVPIQFKSGTGTAGATGVAGRTSASSGGLSLSKTWTYIVYAILLVFVLFVLFNKNVRNGFKTAFKKNK
jgi:hypothetical protein